MTDNHDDRADTRAPDTPELDVRASRRLFLLMGLGGLGTLVGCGEQRMATALPDPVWPTLPEPTRSPQQTYIPSKPRPYNPGPRPAGPANPGPSGVMARSAWSRGEPVPRLMDRMQPARYITVHHDGMSPFTATSTSAAARRIESIRQGHRARGWGDIGYHFAVDPSGRIWAARPLDWQGAHVANQNPGNIGIVCLGNFERQKPNPAQLAGLNRAVAELSSRHQVPISRVRTHQEWSTASTLCPGRHMQSYMVAARGSGYFS